MRAFYGAFLCVLAVASSLCAAPPEVPRELKCEPGQLLRIVAKGDKVGTLKNFTDEDAFFDELTPRPKERRFVFQATKPGVYVVGFFTVGETEGVATTIVVGDGGINVAPKPKPKPPEPKPQPVKVDSVWVIVVEDVNAVRTIEQAKVLNDPFWATLKPRHEYRHYQSSSTVANENGYVEAAKAIGFPAVLVIDPTNGKVLKRFKMSTVAEIANAVKEVSK
jgi:hypothetical protein